MRGHIVFSLQGMGIVIVGFRDQFVEMSFKINTNTRVGILIDRQTRRSVLDKDMYNSCEIRKLGDNLISDEVKTSCKRL